MSDEATPSASAVTTGTGERPVSDRVWTLPNILSFARLLGVPLFVWLLLVPEADVAAAALLAVAGFTDWLDGVLARAWGQVSRLGQLLDPLADRLYIIATLVALVARDILPWWFAAALVARDVALLATLPPLRRHGYGPPAVNYVGKAGTLCLLAAFPLLIMSTVDMPLASTVGALAWGFAWWGLGLYWFAGVLYTRQVAQLVRASRAEAAQSAT